MGYTVLGYLIIPPRICRRIGRAIAGGTARNLPRPIMEAKILSDQVDGAKTLLEILQGVSIPLNESNAKAILWWKLWWILFTPDGFIIPPLLRYLSTILVQAPSIL